MQTQIIRTDGYEKMFLEHYEAALKWALIITKHDRELANDLVHNVYVQFERKHRSGRTFNIDTFDRYLYISLRNSYISHFRKNTRIRDMESPMDDPFVLSVDPRERIKIEDKLYAVCRYACLRKETSISCSVLILRFFHGYFPSEVARIINSSRNVVEARLVSARREAAEYVNDPEKFNFGKYNSTSDKVPVRDRNSPSNVLQSLQFIIFNSRLGKCFEPQQIAEKYTGLKSRLTRSELSHIVSCRVCLDETNKFLGMISLEHRDPIYSLQRESRVVKQESKIEKILTLHAAA